VLVAQLAMLALVIAGFFWNVRNARTPAP